MRLLIIYGSKTGTTEECASKIKATLETRQDAPMIDMHNLAKRPKINLDDYDTIVIGSPIYMGQIRNSVKTFLGYNIEKLMQKNVHFFVCGLARGDEGVELFKKQVPTTLFRHAKQVKQLGGDVHVDRLGFLYKFIMKKILAESKPELGLLDDAIVDFANQID
ncbi:MAG TPA: flavodoxin domain-containing protein [Fusibacter sp.]|nr:flavodoxin domain-containing protein [Fusibacter sp.]